MRTHQHLASAKLAATAVFVGLIVACGGSAAPALTTPQSARFPVTITSPGGTTVTLDHQPRRIVSLSPTATEMLFAIGAKPKRQLRIYHELDNTFYSATSATFIGQVYKLLGLNNIADAASGAASDYPQLSVEYIVAANPDLIVLADTKCCKQDLAAVAARPGWAGIAAVRSGEVVGVDDDIASRWGPRVIDFMQAVAPRVQQLEAQAA